MGRSIVLDDLELDVARVFLVGTADGGGLSFPKTSGLSIKRFRQSLDPRNASTYEPASDTDELGAKVFTGVLGRASTTVARLSPFFEDAGGESGSKKSSVADAAGRRAATLPRPRTTGVAAGGGGDGLALRFDDRVLRVPIPGLGRETRQWVGNCSNDQKTTGLYTAAQSDGTTWRPHRNRRRGNTSPSHNQRVRESNRFSREQICV